MNTNLLDDVGSLMSPNTFGKVAGALGTSTNSTGEATRTSIATLIGGLTDAGRTEDGATRLLNLIHNRHYDEGVAVDRLTSGDPRSFADEGKAILPAIFGNKLDSVVSGVGATSHLQGPAAGWLLSVLTPYVLGAVGQHVREDHLDGRGLSSLLGSQRSHIKDLVPDQLSGLLGVGGTPEYAPPAYVPPPASVQPAYVPPVAVRREVVAAPVRRIEPVKRRGMNWLWTLLPLAALALLLFYVFRTPSPDVKPVKAVPVERTAPVARPEPTPALPIPAPAPMEPGIGIEGFTSALSATEAILPATFEIDDLNFASGSADVPTDQTSITRIAEAMQAHPTARVRVVGFTDSKGSNEQLAKDRAEAVRAALIENGVAADRIEAIGQSGTGAVATNETAEGRSENRTEIVLLQR